MTYRTFFNSLTIDDLDMLNYSPNIWHDASDESTIELSDATHVERWRDKSGYNRHMVQWTVANQPIYTGDGIEFQDDIFQYMVENDSLLSGGFTAILVTNTTNQQHQDPGLFRGRNLITEERWDAPSPYVESVAAIRADSAWRLGNTHTTFGVTKCNIYLISGAGGTVYYYLNGDLDYQYDFTTLGTDATYRYFGGRYASTDYSGKVYEIVIIPEALSSDDRSDIEEHLISKWSIT
ncbi:MAG: hypothetical protein ACXABY_07095 [Candidatus Thorarchaeota archaeon]|jgi:hypothetical protein